MTVKVARPHDRQGVPSACGSQAKTEAGSDQLIFKFAAAWNIMNLLTWQFSKLYCCCQTSPLLLRCWPGLPAGPAAGASWPLQDEVGRHASSCDGCTPSCQRILPTDLVVAIATASAAWLEETERAADPLWGTHILPPSRQQQAQPHFSLVWRLRELYLSCFKKDRLGSAADGKFQRRGHRSDLIA